MALSKESLLHTIMPCESSALSKIKALEQENAHLKKRLQTQKEKSCYQLAAEGAHHGIWDWNILNDRIDLSQDACKLVGFDSDRAQCTFADFKKSIHPEDLQDILAILDAHLTRGFHFQVECRVKQKDLSYVWVELSGKAVLNNHNMPIRMAGIIQDIVNRKILIERLTETNKSLERFAYICSHDLKEPARIIDNFLDIFIEDYHDAIDEDGHFYLSRIKKSSQRLQTMISDILHHSKMGNKQIVYKKTNIRSIINEALENLSLTIEEKKAQIDFGTFPDAYCDRAQIFQIFQNLIGNALKFCQKKRPIILIGCLEHATHLEFTIKDNGIGIEPTHRERIFEMFRRLHSDHDYAGTGIGLTICQKIIENHGGKIWVESELNEGSTFHFTLPHQTT